MIGRGENSDISYQFTGEEPHFRTPKAGTRGVIECYGIYVENWATFLGDQVRKATAGRGVAELNGVNVRRWSRALRETKNPPLAEGPDMSKMHTIFRSEVSLQSLILKSITDGIIINSELPINSKFVIAGIMQFIMSVSIISPSKDIKKIGYSLRTSNKSPDSAETGRIRRIQGCFLRTRPKPTHKELCATDLSGFAAH